MGSLLQSGDQQDRVTMNFFVPLVIDADSFNNNYVIDQERGSMGPFTSNGLFTLPRLKVQTLGEGGLSVLEDVEIHQFGNIYN
jgi:hypothetical protein